MKIFHNGAMRKLTPLLMKPELVAQTLKDIKTETRRLNGLELLNTHKEYLEPSGTSDLKYHTKGRSGECFLFRTTKIAPKDLSFSTLIVNSPYGQVGDIIWVRETFVKVIIDHEFSGREIEYAYKATPDDTEARFGSITNGRGKRFIDSFKWKPNIHMPFAACRLLLEITEVRLERLQDITEESAIAEGVEKTGEFWIDYTGGLPFKSARFSFCSLWYSINGRESWGKNPWVWVIRYKRTEVDKSQVAK